MSIFSSPQKQIEQAAEKVKRLRVELDAAEREHRAARAEIIVARLGKIKGDTLRAFGQAYSASDLARQTAFANDTDLTRFEHWLDEHEARAR